MRIGFIGAGKVGTSFGLFLKNRNIEVTGYNSRTDLSAENAAELTGTTFFRTKKELVENSDIIFLTVNDDNIEIVAEEISGYRNFLGEKIFVHMSGALSSSILADLQIKGCTVASLHPMYPFSNIEKAQKDLHNVKFALEGEGKDYNKLKDILNNVKIDVSEIISERKTLYHGAACIASNYLVSLIDISKKILVYSGFEDKKAMDTIEELVKSTVENIFLYDTQKALTGPISRGDASIIAKHIEALKNSGNNQWLQIYRIMGKFTNELAFAAEKINMEQKNHTDKELEK